MDQRTYIAGASGLFDPERSEHFYAGRSREPVRGNLGCKGDGLPVEGVLS